jgi:hypothetical protein
MAGFNDTELVRVFTREPGDTIADLTLPVTTDGEVVLEAEAGTAIHSTGAQFNANIIVRDLTANDLIAATPAAGVSGQMNTAAWPALNQTFVFTLPQANLTGRANHICQATAFVTVGIGPNQDVSFAESPIFMLTA